MKTNPYSAIIIAFNAERTIEPCLLALKQLTDDVVLVLDDRSSDKTQEIAERLGVNIHIKKWQGYSASKNYGSTLAKSDWILCFDSDEVPDKNLIKQLLQLEPSEYTAYEMNRMTWIGDQPVKHSGMFPDWTLRLYNKRWMKWNESPVHEKLVSSKVIKIKKIPGTINHYSFVDENHLREKHLTYAKLRALEWYDTGVKPPLIKRWLGPHFRFFRTYILKLGFLDGQIGLAIAKNDYRVKKRELKLWREFLNNKNIEQS